MDCCLAAIGLGIHIGTGITGEHLDNFILSHLCSEVKSRKARLVLDVDVDVGLAHKHLYCRSYSPFYRKVNGSTKPAISIQVCAKQFGEHLNNSRMTSVCSAAQ